MVRQLSRSGMMIDVLVFLAALVQLGAANWDGCLFPSRWEGRWFQSGVIPEIVIDANKLSNKGKCLATEGDKFLVVNSNRCYRCVVIHEKHVNVLQYKETYCHDRETLASLCSKISGDAVLFSMFREDGSAVTCPLKGPFSFTYNRGHGDCKSPVSSIESCTEESRLLLNFQACPDVDGSESAVEELECRATWKEGSLRYLVGKVHHNHATSNEDRYRCFVYEKSNSIGMHTISKDDDDGIEYRVAQSGDATCNGLFSAMEGSRTLSLKRVPSTWKCRFPSWMAFPGHWHTLDYSSTYSFHQKNLTLRITNQTGADIKVHCAHIKNSMQTDTTAVIIAHWQHQCMSQYVCVAFHRRSTHAVEMQTGTPTFRSEDACSSAFFDFKTAPFVTLVTSNPESRDCPYSGKFNIAGLKIHQRNVRSLEKINMEDSNTHEKHGKNFKIHRKHRYNDSTSSGDKLSFAEHKKKKYQIFLDKIFAKEAVKRELKLKHHINNNTHSVLNVTNGDNSFISNISLKEISRSRRSSGKIDASLCVNNDFTMLDIGCNSVENMEFHSACDKEFITAYSCHGGWTENGTSFLITTPLTRDSIGAKRFCFIYKESPDKIIHFTRSSVSCDRSIRPGIDGSLIFNATLAGECLQTSSGISVNKNIFKTLILDWFYILSVLFLSHQITR